MCTKSIRAYSNIFGLLVKYGEKRDFLWANREESWHLFDTY
jgi:hypothetical protein